MIRCLSLSLVFVILIAIACSSPAPSGTEVPTDAWPNLLKIPHPDLSSAETSARRSLEEQRRALQDLRSNSQTPPSRLAEAFGRMGDFYQAYELAEAADACYENARSLQEDEFRWHYAQGLLQAETGHLKKAEARFRDASSLRPRDGAAALRRGEALLSLGRPEEALQSFDTAQEISPAYEAAALLGIGRAQAALGLSKDAVGSFQKVLELLPEAGVVRYPLARALQKLGRTQEAQTVLAGSSAGSVSFPDPIAEEIRDLAAGSAALVARGGEALVAGRLERAEALYRQAMVADPSNIEARRNLAVTLTRAGRPGDAAQILEAALRLDPNHALTSFDLANARLATGDLEGAVASFQRALAAAPDLEAAHFNLANAHMQAQSWTQAEESLRQVLELSPENLQASYLLAMSRFQQGQTQEGLQGLRQVLIQDPSMTAARMSLASILAQTGPP